MERRWLAAMGTGVAALALSVAVVGQAGAQSGSGRLTGRVVWCLTAPYPLPFAPGLEGAAPAVPVPAPAPPVVDSAQAETPDTAVPGRPGIIRPIPPRPLPAGAVLVAAQGTPLATKTDETGRFSLENVPGGVYLTVAAGPVASVGGAFASRPNALVAAGQSADLGTLVLNTPTNSPCQVRIFAPGAAGAAGAEGEIDAQP